MEANARMEPKTWTWINRTGWGDGPWDDEPDKVEWRDAVTLDYVRAQCAKLAAQVVR
jgi:hypothetical protein